MRPVWKSICCGKQSKEAYQDINRQLILCYGFLPLGILKQSIRHYCFKSWGWKHSFGKVSKAQKLWSSDSLPVQMACQEEKLQSGISVQSISGWNALKIVSSRARSAILDDHNPSPGIKLEFAGCGNQVIPGNTWQVRYIDEQQTFACTVWDGLLAERGRKAIATIFGYTSA